MILEPDRFKYWFYILLAVSSYTCQKIGWASVYNGCYYKGSLGIWTRVILIKILSMLVVLTFDFLLNGLLVKLQNLRFGWDLRGTFSLPLLQLLFLEPLVYMQVTVHSLICSLWYSTLDHLNKHLWGRLVATLDWSPFYFQINV